MVTQLGERGLGSAIIPASTTGPGLRAVPITDPVLSSRLEFAWGPSAASPTARMLVQHVRSGAAGRDL